MYISRKKRNRQEYIKEQGVVGNASEQLRSVDLFAEDAQTINADRSESPGASPTYSGEGAAQTFESVSPDSMTEHDTGDESVAGENTAADADGAEAQDGDVTSTESHAARSYAEPFDASASNGEIVVPTDPQDLDTVHDVGTDMTYDEFLRANTGEGVLRVQASAGNRSIPLVNVNIEVYKDFLDGRHLFYKAVTNADGVVDNLKLPAPPRENSVLGNGLSPFASYIVKASRDGLITETVENVPVFSGVKSIQGINMSSSL